MEDAVAVDWQALDTLIRRALQPLALQAADTDDVVQDTLSDVFERLGVFPPVRSVNAYATRVAKRKATALRAALRGRERNFTDMGIAHV